MGKIGVGKRAIVLLIVVLQLVSAWPEGAAAQGQIEVASNRAVLRFPDTVTFKIDVSAQADSISNFPNNVAHILSDYQLS